MVWHVIIRRMYKGSLWSSVNKNVGAFPKQQEQEADTNKWVKCQVHLINTWPYPRPRISFHLSRRRYQSNRRSPVYTTFHVTLSLPLFLPMSSDPPKQVVSLNNGWTRRDRPCDACRRRKSRCIIPQDSETCIMCQSRLEQCTFVQKPQGRKRRKVEGDSPGDGTKPGYV